MADHVEGNNMVSTKSIVPWHRAGHVIPNEVITGAEAMAYCNQHWLVDKVAAFIAIQHQVQEMGLGQSRWLEVEGQSSGGDDTYTRIETSYEESPETFFTVRSDKQGAEAILGTVGSQYTPIQNEQMYEFCDALVAEGGAKYETAGTLKGGRTVWCLANFPDHVSHIAGPKDEIKMYLLVANSHDGTKALTAAVTPIRTVCWNTLALGLRTAKSSWSLRHTSGIEGRVDEARAALGLLVDYQNQWEFDMRRLLDRPCAPDEFETMVQHLRPVAADGEVSTQMENDRQGLRSTWTSDPTVNMTGMEGSRYAALQAVSAWADHSWGSPQWRKGNAEAVLQRNWWGSSYHLKRKAHELLVKDTMPEIQVQVRTG